MNVSQALFSASDRQSAIQCIKHRTGCGAVRQLPIAMLSDNKLYVATDLGEIFFLKEYSDGVFVTQRNPEGRHTKSGRQRIRLCTEGHGKEITYDIATLIWCTFVKGLYSKDILPGFRNGNSKDCRLANLQINNTVAQQYEAPLWSADIYATYHADYCEYCQHLMCDIDEQDAKDIVSNAFLEVLQMCQCADKLRILWKMYIKKRIIDYHRKMCNRVPFDNEWFMPTYTALPEIDFSLLCHRPSEAAVIRGLQQGYSIQDQCEMTGGKRSLISSNATRGIQEIRRKLWSKYRVV